MNNFVADNHDPVDLREVCRVDALRTCCLPHHKKGQAVWVLNGPFWSKAVIERRLPGNVYAARLVGMPRQSSYCIVSAAVYGGLAE